MPSEMEKTYMVTYLILFEIEKKYIAYILDALQMESKYYGLYT